MDYEFPRQLFPSFYDCGPPDSVLKSGSGSWGSYDGVLPQAGSGPLSSWTFTSRHQIKGETWRHTEPVPVPFLSPRNAFLTHVTPPDPLDFTEHMQNFFLDHSQDAFGCMSEILGENFNFRDGGREKHRRGSVSMWRVRRFLQLLDRKICFRTHQSLAMSSYCRLLSDVAPDIPPPLLGSLLYEELAEQRDRLLFCEAATGGALAYVPFAERGKREPQRGCLLHPAGRGLDRLEFHQVDVQRRGGTVSCASGGGRPVSFQLKAAVRQISCSSLLDDCCVAVRAGHFCGAWRFSERDEPRLLQVVNSGEAASCVSVSPHVLGEVLVASESGAANLWTVGKGMQKVRVEDGNLYFNANSAWRWCEFSAHPRVVLYADRTGAELTDIRVSPTSGHTLFRISSTSECRSGERLILSRYLGDIHPFHHLVTTQYSAYIMDERFPCVPMLKYGHMMQSPPMFCHVIPSGASTSGTSKVLLGSHGSQEVTLLQYSGGRAEACSSQGPPQALLRPKESLKHLSVQIPHRRDTAANRLSAPVTGLTCVPTKPGGVAGREECLCVLQLTEAGDIFYQILERDQAASGAPPADSEQEQAANDLPASTRRLAEPPAASQVVSETASDDDVIGPTQGVSGKTSVAETPERDRRRSSRFSVSSESESRRRRRASRSDDDGDGAGMQTPGHLSPAVFMKWKRWLQILTERSGDRNPRRRRPQHFQTKAKGLLCLAGGGARGASQDDRVEKLRETLKSCMSGRSLLLQRSVCGALPAPDPVPCHSVSTSWTDALSRRLTIAWQGKEAWQAWWEDHLGINEKAKTAALRRKRRKEKEARRAAGRRLELSGSFTSASDQSEPDDFSSSAGWSTASSQAAWSGAEDSGVLSQLAVALEHRDWMDALVATPTATPQSVKLKQSEPQTPSRLSSFSFTQTLPPDNTPARQRRSKRTVEDYLSTLTSTQDFPSQQDSYFLEMDNFTDTAPPSASSALIHSSQSLQVSMSRAAGPSSGPSLTFSQSSQGRQAPSQSSQPKKKSRMGF